MARHVLTAAVRPALAGLLSAGAAIGVAELVAVLVRPDAAPLTAVGREVIDRTPTPIKEFAVREFGTSDKLYLQSGIAVLLALFALVVGLAARKKLAVGVGGVLLFGAVGVYSALHRPDARFLDPVPSIVGALIGAVLLVYLIRVVWAADPAGAPASARPEEQVDEAGQAGQVDEPAGAEGPAEADQPAEAAGIDRDGHATRPARRRFLQVSGLAAVGALAAGFGGRALQGLRFNANKSRDAIVLPKPASAAKAVPNGVQADGASSFITQNAKFYRVDTALNVPQVPADTWQLKIHGMVSKEITLSYEDLLKRPLMERVITMTCVSNEIGGPYVSTAKWLGASLKDLLEEAGVDPKADQIVAKSTDGMTIGTPVDIAMDGRDAMIAVGMNGEPLPLEHGFPARMLVPGLYGYVSACKWIVDIELTTFDAYDPYWVQRGWSERAPIKTESRIDSPKAFAQVKAGTVAVAGVAWAQHRGIKKVEVKVDDGPWEEAKLAGEYTSDTWRQWVYPWQASAGAHTLYVRATDNTGETQTDKRVTPFPNGATGWASTLVTVT